jgi:hypothetical protein
MDIVVLGIVIGLAVLSLGLIAVCDSLLGGTP